MTTTDTIRPTPVTREQNHPSKRYGQQAKAPVESAEAMILSRAAFSPEIPRIATITSATLTYRQVGAIGTSVTVSVQPNASKFDSRTTWNTRPNATGSVVSLTKSSPANDTAWVFDVTAHVQDFIDGDLPNFGWRISTTSTTRRYFKGAVAASGKPVLTFTYETIPPAPSNLVPNGGAVSTDKPVVAWDQVPGILKVQVQVDPAANGVTPAFDSGEVTATTAQLNLASTAYAGLAGGATTFWRARVRTPGGLSAWSSWATFSRTAKGVVTITNPGGTSADGSPPLVATFSGVVKQWHVSLRDTLTNAVLAVSGWQTDPAIEWTPPTGVTRDGRQGTFAVQVVDDVERVATPGDPVAAIATQTFTLALSATVPALDSFDVEQRDHRPSVWLVGTRSEIPDEVAVFREVVGIDVGERQIARVPGTDVFTDEAFEWADHTAPMNYTVRYRVAPVVNDEVASSGATRSLTPTCLGKWLIAEDDGTALVLAGTEGDVPDGNDVAVLHQPVTGDAAVVRRRLSRPPRSGAEDGDVLDLPPLKVTADETLAIIEEFGASDQGRLYRLVLGHLNLRVIAGDFIAWPTPLSSKDERVAVVSFSWWGQGEDAVPAS